MTRRLRRQGYDVPSWTGRTCVAFVFDVHSRAVVGWTAAATRATALVSKP